MSDIGAGSNNAEELVWDAKVNDKTKDFFDAFDKRLSQTDANTNAKFGAMGSSITKLAPLIGLVGGAFGAIGSSILKAVTGGITGIGQLIRETSKLRTETDSLNNSLEAQGQIAGYSSQQLDDYTESLKEQGLTTRNSLSLLNQMIQAELDLNEAQNLVAIGQDASIIKGVTVEAATTSLVQAIDSQNDKLLKSLGIYVNFEAEYQRVALATNRTVEQISSQERQQIALNAALAAGSQIAGSYDKSQTTLSRTLRALPSYYEEVKYAIGGMFEPVQTAALLEWEQFLKDLVKWLQDNEEELNALGVDMANFVSGSGKLFLQLMMQLIEVIPQLVSAIPDLARTIADDLGPALGVSVQEMENAGSEMQTLLKLIIMVTAGFKAARKVASETYGSIFNNSGEFLKNLTDLGKQPVLQLAEIVKVFADLKDGGDISENTTSFVQEFKSAFDELSQTYDMFGESQEEAAESTNAFTTAAEQQAIAAQKLKDSLTTANYKLNELKKTLEEEALTRSIQEQRDQIIEAIQQSRKREDIERNYAERVQDIMENASKSRSKLYEDLAENEYEIEKDHQQRLQDLLEDFTFEANELARKRDAVGLLSLIRRNKRQLSEEEQAAERRKQDARQNFQETIRDMDEALKEQLEKAYEARTKEYENMARSLQREKELKDLYDKWEEEDRQRKLDKTLSEMWKFFQGMDGMTQAGLNQLLNDWGTYYQSLANMANVQNAAMSSAYSTKWKYVVGPTSTLAPTAEQIAQQRAAAQQASMTQNTGQSGLVSSLLINSLDVSRNLARNVPVNPRESTDTRNIKITVDGTGLDPYIQRLVVNTLAEIERNRG